MPIFWYLLTRHHLNSSISRSFRLTLCIISQFSQIFSFLRISSVSSTQELPGWRGSLLWRHSQTPHARLSDRNTIKAWSNAWLCACWRGTVLTGFLTDFEARRWRSSRLRRSACDPSFQQTFVNIVTLCAVFYIPSILILSSFLFRLFFVVVLTGTSSDPPPCLLQPQLQHSASRIFLLHTFFLHCKWWPPPTVKRKAQAEL